MRRALAVLTILLFAAFPLRAAATDPSIPLLFKLGWSVLFLIGLARPAWCAPIVVILVPFLPWVPFEIKGVPFGLVHFIVLSQALPWLIRAGIGGRDFSPGSGEPRPWRGAVAWCWLLLMALAVASLAVQYAGYAATFETGTALLREIGGHLDTYPSARPGPSLEHMLGATMALVTGCLVFALVRTATWPRERLLECLGGTAIGVALVGFWQAQTGTGLRLEWRINDPFITRINSTFSDPNALAAFLAATVPLLLALAGRSRGRARAWWASGAAVVSVALVMTAGRIAAAAALVGLCALAALIIRAGVDRLDPSPLLRRTFRRTAVTVIVLIVVAGAALAVAGTTLDARHAGQQTYLDTWLYTLNLRRPLEAAKGRLEIWQAAVRMIQDRPAFGIGIGRIYRLFAYYARDLRELPQGMSFSAHSTFLNIGAELGLIGLLGWLCLLGASLREALGRIRPGTAAGSPEERWIDAGLAGGLIALIVTMTTGDRAILYEDLTLLGVLTGLLASAQAAAPASTPRREQLLRYAALGLVLLIVLSLPVRMLAERRGVPLDRVTAGLYPLETSRYGIRYRWTTGHAVFYVPASATALKVRLRSVTRFPQTTRIVVRGTEVFSRTFNRDEWIEVRPLLPRTPGDRYHRIEVLTSPTWTPRNDGRELGVMVDWEWR